MTWHLLARMQEVLPAACQPVAKTDFTMLVPEIQEQLKSMQHIKQIVLCGIEAHVCVFQTALDLLGEPLPPSTPHLGYTPLKCLL